MRYLIVKTSSIGDLVHTFPVLEYLKKQDPEALIDWMVEGSFADLIEAHPLVSRVIRVNTRQWRRGRLLHEIPLFYDKLREKEYDLLIDLQGNGKSALLALCARSKKRICFAHPTLPEKWNYLLWAKRYRVSMNSDVRLRYLELVQQHFKDQAPFVAQEVVLKAETSALPDTHSLRLMVSPGSNWKNKRLQDAQLMDLLDQIHKAFSVSFFFTAGNLAEESLLKRLQDRYSNSQAVIRPRLSEWQALMRQMDGVIAMDSAALHLAATTNTPTFSFFGPSSSHVYAPKGAQHRFLQGSCPYGQNFVIRCPKLRSCTTGACLHDLSIQKIFASLEPWLNTICRK